MFMVENFGHPINHNHTTEHTNVAYIGDIALTKVPSETYSGIYLDQPSTQLQIVHNCVQVIFLSIIDSGKCNE